MLQAIAETSQDPKIEIYLYAHICMFSDYIVTVKIEINKKSYCSEMTSLLAPDLWFVFLCLRNLCLNTSVCSGYGTFYWEVWESYRRGLGGFFVESWKS